MQYEPTTPQQDGFSMPAEFSPHQGCILIWPERPGSWKNGAAAARKAFRSVIAAIAESETVYVAVNPHSRPSAERMLAGMANVRLLDLDSDDAWARDVAPTFVRRAADGAVRGFLASGHAGGKKIRGYDLVCCAVSALTQTGVNALEAVAKVTPVVAVRDGYLRCELPQAIDAGRMEKAQIVLQTVMTGLTDIQKIYPNLIRIQQEEWRQADAYDESSALRS